MPSQNVQIIKSQHCPTLIFMYDVWNHVKILLQPQRDKYPNHFGRWHNNVQNNINFSSKKT